MPDEQAYFNIRCDQWEIVATYMPAAWTTAAVEIDLLYWASRGGRPGRGVLAARWGWGEKRIRSFLEVADAA